MVVKWTNLVVLAVFIQVLNARVSAQTPLGTAFTYQGQLKDGGSPANGPHDMHFRLYDAASGGTQLGPVICYNNLSVADGLFTATLDFGDQFPGEERYLEIAIRVDTGLNCANTTGFNTLAPRQRLTAAPNALNADKLDGLDSTAFLQSIPVPLTLSGTSAGSYIILGQNSSADLGSSAIRGYCNATSGLHFGVIGVNDSTAGRGVAGQATATTGAASGVQGASASTEGRGVHGIATAATGTTSGGLFESSSTSGRGVVGLANAATGVTYGGRFESSSTRGYGVFGLATNTGDWNNYGGYFECAGRYGYGVYGLATNTNSGTAFGVYGESASPFGCGVYGHNSRIGVSDAPYGVYGSCSTVGYAVYADGDFGASGTKAFRIDHPSDPENKYLLHYSIESPEVLNAYSGKVTLDAHGEAVIELPTYFARINKDPRYTLTAVGAPMPNLHVAEEISEESLRAGEQAGPGDASPICWFRIASGVPGEKVSWRVEAVRNDLRMRLLGAPVEREKNGPERGKYQHPEYYGQPAEMRALPPRAPARNPSRSGGPAAGP